MHINTLAMVLVGGVGIRLYPLTRDRVKPAVPFGGIYRLIDFVLSNCLNSNIRRVCVLTQYKSLSLERHIRYGWSFLPHTLEEHIQILSPQQRVDSSWYQGTADAVYQNVYSIDQSRWGGCDSPAHEDQEGQTIKMGRPLADSVQGYAGNY